MLPKQVALALSPHHLAYPLAGIIPSVMLSVPIPSLANSGVGFGLNTRESVRSEGFGLELTTDKELTLTPYVVDV